ncbi:MAG: RAD55 family ATPase [Haloferacaceae archaeon]
MARIPFGVERLDDVVGGGAPAGSLVLLVGEPGAGAREFLYTSAAMNGLATGDPELFDLHYGDVDERAETPPEIHYVSFTTGEEYLEGEMADTMDAEIVEAALPEVAFRDLSPEYFQLSPAPRPWYMGETRSVTDLGRSEHTDDVLDAFGGYLSRHAPGNLVLVDAVTDLVAATSEDLHWNDVAMVMKGLKKAAREWGGLIVALANREVLDPTQLGKLTDAATGTLVFEWESGGSQRARTLFVKAFRGVLSRLEEENIVRFETEVHEAGFDVTNVRKIR